MTLQFWILCCRDLVEIYLVSEKFDVIKCYDGDTALDAIEHEKIDLAILDIMLPGLSRDISGK